MSPLTIRTPHFTDTTKFMTTPRTARPTDNFREFVAVAPSPSVNTSFSNRPLSVTSVKFGSFLSSLENATDDTVASDVARGTRVFLLALYLAMRQTIPDPQALMSNDGYLSLAWEREGNQFSVEVYPDWKIDWFWRNKFTKEVLLDEGIPFPPLPEVFARKFKEAFGQHSVIGCEWNDYQIQLTSLG